MRKEQMLRNMCLILSREEMRRISVNGCKNGKRRIDLDLHGLTRKQAERLVRNVIYVNRAEFVLNVIHGYNHGTALKTMVNETVFGKRVVDRWCPASNPGQTYLEIAA